MEISVSCFLFQSGDSIRDLFRTRVVADVYMREVCVCVCVCVRVCARVLARETSRACVRMRLRD